jgi:hypothetical protein
MTCWVAIDQTRRLNVDAFGLKNAIGRVNLSVVEDLHLENIGWNQSARWKPLRLR